MSSRSWLSVLVAAVLLVAGPLALMRWWGDRALAQVTPAGDVRWDGYVIRHEWRREAGFATAWGELHFVRIDRGNTQVLEQTFFVRENDFREGPMGFFGGLNVDDDAELELVHCQDGVVEAIVEPDRENDVLSPRASGKATSRAQELCESVHRAGLRPDFTCVVCCVVPLFVPAFIAVLIRARRERREEERVGRSTF